MICLAKIFIFLTVMLVLMFLKDGMTVSYLKLFEANNIYKSACTMNFCLFP